MAGKTEFGFTENPGGVFVSGGSMANITAPNCRPRQQTDRHQPARLALPISPIRRTVLWQKLYALSESLITGSAGFRQRQIPDEYNETAGSH